MMVYAEFLGEKHYRVVMPEANKCLSVVKDNDFDIILDTHLSGGI
jgi:hypothetical protein